MKGWEARGGSGRVALLSPYDGGNLGDAAIQEALIAGFRRCDPQIWLCGVTLYPGGTSARHHIPCYPLAATSRPHYRITRVNDEKRDGVHSSPTPEAAVSLFGRLRRLARSGLFAVWIRILIDEAVHVIRSYRLLRKVDVLVIAGGGQLDEEWGGSWAHPYALMKWSVLARAAGSSVVFLCVGACRIESRLTRLFLRTALSLACYRSYRDAESRRLALGITLRADGLVVPDLAFSLSAASIEPSRRAEGAAFHVGVSPIAYGHAGLWPTADQVQYERYIAELACFVREILRSGDSVTLFSSSSPDDQIFIDLHKNVGLGLDSASRGQLFTSTVGTVGELLAVLHSVDLVVASRLHGVLLSFLSGKPAIAISYDRKVTCLMEELGQATYCVDIRSFKTHYLLERLSVLRAHSEVMQSTVAATCRQYLEILQKQYQDITQLALGRRRRQAPRNPTVFLEEEICAGTPEIGRLGLGQPGEPSSVSAPVAPGTSNRDEMSYGKQ